MENREGSISFSPSRSDVKSPGQKDPHRQGLRWEGMACRKLGACNTLLASVGAGLMQTEGETVSSTSLPQSSDPQGGPRAPPHMPEDAVTAPNVSLRLCTHSSRAWLTIRINWGALETCD